MKSSETLTALFMFDSLSLSSLKNLVFVSPS